MEKHLVDENGRLFGRRPENFPASPGSGLDLPNPTFQDKTVRGKLRLLRRFPPDGSRVFLSYLPQSLRS